MSADKLIIVAVAIAISSPAASSPNPHDGCFPAMPSIELGSAEPECGAECPLWDVHEASSAPSPMDGRIRIDKSYMLRLLEYHRYFEGKVDELPLRKLLVTLRERNSERRNDVEISSMNLLNHVIARGKLSPSLANNGDSPHFRSFGFTPHPWPVCPWPPVCPPVGPCPHPVFMTSGKGWLTDEQRASLIGLSIFEPDIPIPSPQPVFTLLGEDLLNNQQQTFKGALSPPTWKVQNPTLYFPYSYNTDANGRLIVQPISGRF